MLRRVFFPASQFWVSLYIGAFAALFCAPVPAQAQLPYLNGGPNSVFARIDFGQAYLSQQIWDPNSTAQTDVIDFSGVSALDLEAPNKAIDQYNQATSLLRGQKLKDAIKYLLKAIAIYPKFVSAHNALGLAYLEQSDDSRARTEFETAVSFDNQFPGSFVNLGVLALWSNDFGAAVANFDKAASHLRDDPKVLMALAFAENGNHQYSETLHTVEAIHRLDHHAVAAAHYIAAAAAMSLHEDNEALKQLDLLLAEDPANPLSPIARKQLQALSNSLRPAPRAEASASIQEDSARPSTRYVTFPNSKYLQAQLVDLKKQTDEDDCSICSEPEPPLVSSDTLLENSSVIHATSTPGNPFTIHRIVDETALFFSVSHHGHTVDDLSIADIQIRDDDKPPAKIVEFIPQSRLPLRLGLLIDTSNSVEKRFSFEKRAAERFMDRVLNSDSDLAFVAGFNTDITVTQDFNADPIELAKGIESLSNDGQTSLFDAVYYACWKLAAYPDEGRVARVLVVLTDGEDNSSHSTLKQALQQAEASGVTIYAVSTAEDPDYWMQKLQDESDADRVLEMLAQRSGGQAMFPHDLRGLDRELAKLPDVIRNRYLVAYRPAEFAPNGKYRTIAVTAEKDGKRLQVNVRKGYYARSGAE